MNTFDFIFEDLPLVTFEDVVACLIAGEAEISYDRAGLWEVEGVTVDGYRAGKHVSATAPEVIRSMIVERLYGLWHDKVQEAVREQLEIDREEAAESIADMKLSERGLDP